MTVLISEYRRAPDKKGRKTSKALAIPDKVIKAVEIPDWVTKVPKSRSAVRQQKKWWNNKFKDDAAAKRKKYHNEIKYKTAQIKKLKATAKAKIRDKHTDIEDVFRKHNQHGGRWTEFSKKVPWSRASTAAALPLSDIHKSKLALHAYPTVAVADKVNYIDVDATEPSMMMHPQIPSKSRSYIDASYKLVEPRKALTAPAHFAPVGLLGQGNGPITDPSRLLANPYTRSVRTTFKRLLAPHRFLPAGHPAQGVPLLLPPGGGPDIENMKRVGPMAPIALPPHVKGLLPVPRSIRSKMQSLMNKLSTATS